MNSFFYFLFIYFNFCNVMLISAAEECKSAVIICTSTPSLASLPSPFLQVSTEHQTGLPSSLLQSFPCRPLPTRTCLRVRTHR